MRPDAGRPDAHERGARVPLATYRLQLHPGFGFAAARDLVPYLAALGVSDVYTSSYLAARPGSRHGYDVVDHGRLNLELGTEAEHRAFCVALAARGMGHLLDVVPNHMGIAGGANQWWNDVLENGPGSARAAYFDIDWEPVEQHLHNKVLLPILGDQYGRVLERQELTLFLEDGAFRLRYWETVLPVEPRSTARLLAGPVAVLTDRLGEDDAALEELASIATALANLPAPTETDPERVRERTREARVIRRRLAAVVAGSEAVRASMDQMLAALNGTKGEPRSFDALDRLLDEQPYRLAHWRVAAEEINYRRFFDVNELAAIRMEVPEVFREAHRLVLRLVEEGLVTGLRIDHPDGLFDPAGYFRALQRERDAQRERAAGGAAGADEGVAGADEGAAAARTAGGAVDPGGRPLYVVAEKILGHGERLSTGWAIHGTTGYEFAATIDRVLVDPAGVRALGAVYARFTGLRTPYAEVTYESKRLVVRTAMASELEMLGHALSRLARRSRVSRDFTRASLVDALREVIACFPLYRTYIDGRAAEPALQDRACVEVAAAFARRRNPTTNVSIFEFVRDTLLLRPPEDAGADYARDQLAFARTFQQLTSPVMAKGVEDTAFYRYNRLVSLNEVGGDPERGGVSPDELHRWCAARLRDWPAGLSTTSTHDTKRSEDVRARIHVLSEMPRAWHAAVRRWHSFNRRHLRAVDGRPAPDRNDEYMLYQTLAGAWPLEESRGGLDFARRIQEYMVKAAREAKVHTSWISPHEAYEEALRAFVGHLLDPALSPRFLADFRAWHAPVARLGMVNALARTVLKLAAPGVPDLYQGTELWDLSLVDPDNRRPVDWAARRLALDELTARVREGALGAYARDALAHWEDGRVKLLVTHRGLACRQAAPALFARGDHVPLDARGAHAARIVAFARRLDGDAVVALAPRLTGARTGLGARLPLGADAWEDTELAAPADLSGEWTDAFTGARTRAERVGDSAVFRASAALAEFPVALFVRPR